jgi:hypothetical protein
MGPHFTFPPGLFPDSYLVLPPAGLFLLLAVLLPMHELGERLAAGGGAGVRALRAASSV